MNGWSIDLPGLAQPLPWAQPMPPAPRPAQAPAPLPADVFSGGPRAISPADHPPGQGAALVASGVPVASNAQEVPGASFTGRVARESVRAFQQAGGVTYLGLGRANGNREVAVWASPGFDPARPYEVLLYNRGIDGDNAMALSKTHMAAAVTQLNQAGRNVLVVMPKSPKEMHTWFAPPEHAGSLMQEALQGFADATGLRLGAPTETWLMSHSGGGKSVSNILAQPNVPHFDKIMLADSTYGTWAADAARSLEGRPGPEVAAVVTPHNAERARTQLSARGIRVDAMPADAQFKDHEGVPSYMLAAFVGPAPTLSFSGFQPGQGWRPDPSPRGDVYQPTGVAPTLIQGARGLAVRALQQRLSAAGFDPGVVDGMLGPNTAAAIRRAQAAHGLPTTGVADATTQAALL